MNALRLFSSQVIKLYFRINDTYFYKRIHKKTRERSEAAFASAASARSLCLVCDVGWSRRVRARTGTCPGP